jgi:hypothetical protein
MRDIFVVLYNFSRKYRSGFMDVRLHESLLIDEIEVPFSEHYFEVAGSSSFTLEDAKERSVLRHACLDKLTMLRNRFWLMNYLRSRIYDTNGAAIC